MNLLNSHYETAVDKLKTSFVTGEVERQKDSPYGTRILEAAAADDFAVHLSTISEWCRDDVREEEMRIAAEAYEETERDIENMERKLRDANALALQEVSSFLRLIRDKSATPADGEAWAYQDGWNAAIEKLELKIKTLTGE